MDPPILEFKISKGIYCLNQRCPQKLPKIASIDTHPSKKKQNSYHGIDNQIELSKYIQSYKDKEKLFSLYPYFSSFGCSTQLRLNRLSKCFSSVISMLGISFYIHDRDTIHLHGKKKRSDASIHKLQLNNHKCHTFMGTVTSIDQNKNFFTLVCPTNQSITRLFAFGVYFLISEGPRERDFIDSFTLKEAAS